MGKGRKAKIKKAKKIDAKLDANIPRFLYSNSEITKRRDPVGINDVRDLVLHIIADSPPPSWIRVQHSKTSVLLVPGITSTVLSLPPLPTSAIENRNVPISIPLPPDSPPPTPSSLLTFPHPSIRTQRKPPRSTAPVSGEEKRRRLRERIIAERSAKKDPTQYLLTVEQMVENDYPVPSYLSDVFSMPDGWIETPEADADSKPGYQSVYAIDCEMCITADGKALTRVCVIDYATDKVAYDQFVKPPSPITDYLTRFSGITAEALESITTTLADVQAHLRTLITPSTILVGHSLESDLRALQLSHPRCIDTALIFHHPRGRPLKPGLAWLTRKWLGRTIQDRGPADTIPKRMRGPVPSRGAGTGARTAIVDHGNPGAWHGTSAASPATTVPCTTDAEVLEGVLGALDSHEFVFARLMALADALGWVTPKAAADSGTGPENPETSGNSANPNSNVLFSAVSNLNAQLTTLHAALPPRTADPRGMSVLAGRRAQYQASQNQKRGGATSSTAETDDGEPLRWSTTDDRALEEAVARARMGLLFVGVKS
ncbi:hypothetical protein BJV77DRAFT_1145224 [Russula vinacea]|nr:hypothetical protein BJV77DRAFT_1145224 [Russula vinacea]